MLQNTSKTLGFQKIMVYKTPPGGEVNHIWLVAYKSYLPWSTKKDPIKSCPGYWVFNSVRNFLKPISFQDRIS